MRMNKKPNGNAFVRPIISAKGNDDRKLQTFEMSNFVKSKVFCCN
jgi:hypothetical protein